MSNILAFPMQDQFQNNWCRSAVSVSVDDFFGSPTTWTQCQMANRELAQNSCCLNGISFACDQPWYLDRALVRVGRLSTVYGGRPNNARLFSEIDQRRPVALRIQWNGTSNGHFVAVTGYDDSNPGNPMLEIDDPFYGHSTLEAASFPASYQSLGGAWTHTYETR